MRSLLYRVGIHIIINQGLTSYHLVLVISLASRWQQAVQMGSLPPTVVFWASVPVSVNVEKIPLQLCLQPCCIHLHAWGWGWFRNQRWHPAHLALGGSSANVCLWTLVTGSSFSQWTETGTFKTWLICFVLDVNSRMNCVLVSTAQIV